MVSIGYVSRLGALAPQPTALTKARSTVGAFLDKLNNYPQFDPHRFFGASSAYDVSKPTLRDRSDGEGLEVVWPLAEYRATWAAWKELAKSLSVVAAFPPSDQERYPTTGAVKAGMRNFLAVWDKKYGKRGSTSTLLFGLALAGTAVYYATRK